MHALLRFAHPFWREVRMCIESISLRRVYALLRRNNVSISSSLLLYIITCVDFYRFVVELCVGVSCVKWMSILYAIYLCKIINIKFAVNSRVSSELCFAPLYRILLLHFAVQLKYRATIRAIATTMTATRPIMFVYELTYTLHGHTYAHYYTLTPLRVQAQQRRNICRVCCARVCVCP